MLQHTPEIVFRKAATERDLHEIFGLNHLVFAEEIEQHPICSDGLLVDKFHDKNENFMAETDGRLIGFVSAHWTAPFSVENKCAHFWKLVPRDAFIAEVRLLAVHPEYRKTGIALGLISTVTEYLATMEVEFVVISGIVAQQRMYQQLGFRDLGPPVASGNAEFVPMIVDRAELLERTSKIFEYLRGRYS